VIGAVEREVSRGAEPDVLYPGEAKEKPRPGIRDLGIIG
jgi:hypothetical protein